MGYQIFFIIEIIAICIFGVIALRMLIKSQAHETATSPEEFSGLLGILNAIIQVELDSFDEDVFSNKGSITNQNYENYYKTLTNQIIENIPESFITRMSTYYAEDAIYRHIARRVKNFLYSKITGTT